MKLRKLPIAMLVLGFAFTSPASASIQPLQIWLSQDFAPFANVADSPQGGLAIYTGIFDDFDVHFAASSSSPSSEPANLNLTSLYVQNVGASTANLRILFADSGFVAFPTIHMDVTGSVSGTQVIGNANDVTFESFLDDTNSLYATDILTNASLSSGLVTPDLSSQSFNDSSSGFGYVGGTNFIALAGLVSLTLDPGERLILTGQGSATSFAAMPEPGTAAIWSVFCGLALMLGWRRRQTALVRR